MIPVRLLDLKFLAEFAAPIGGTSNPPHCLWTGMASLCEHLRKIPVAGKTIFQSDI